MPPLTKKLVNKLKTKKGSTIIEVLIATLVVSTVLTAVAAGLTLSIKNTSDSKQRNLGANLAQEAIEVYRREKNILGWATFYGAVNAGTYCFNTLPSNTTEFAALSSGACSNGAYITDTFFTRSVEVSKYSDGLSQVIEVTATVTWPDAGTSKEVSVTQGFREYSTN